MNEFNENGFFTSDFSVERTNNFVRKVLLNMVLGLIITAVVPLYLVFIDPEMLYRTQMYFKPIIIGQFVLVAVLSFAINKISSTVARLLFFIYAISNGVVLSSITFIFSPISILYALAITIIMFIVTAIYGYTTKEDLTKYSGYLMAGLITIIIISLINFFFKVSMIYWVVTILGTVIFSALIAYDINRIKNLAINAGSIDGETLEKLGIFGALSLYLDFINLFLYILRLTSRKK